MASAMTQFITLTDISKLPLPLTVVFDPVDAAVDDLDLLGASLATLNDSAGPQNGGTLTVNGDALGGYDYVVKSGDQIVTSFNAAEWFSAVGDSRSAVIVVVGNLTIAEGVVFTPAARKLFAVIYVTGALTVNGQVSMSRRGADHSAATGANIAAAAIRIINGVHDGVENPQVPAAGAAGAAGQTTGNSPGIAGAAGLAGQTGGGGSGGSWFPSAAGAAGTSFSGGPGSGGGPSADSPPPSGDGGPGGDAANRGAGALSAGGGAGNPGGDGISIDGDAGTGGVLAIFCDVLAGSGAITADGAAGGDTHVATYGCGGGGSGGGSVTVICNTDAGSVTLSAAGGAGGVSNATNSAIDADGGAGGDGTARLLLRAS